MAETRIALRTAGLSRQWGGFHANSDISLSFEVGARHALIGPNGAGKTTFINLLTGVITPSAGSIYLDESDITSLRQHQRVKRGLSRTFQINTLFPGLTVLESLMLALFERDGRGMRWFRTISSQGIVIEEAMQLLTALRLADDAARITRELPYGKQRLLEIALALAAKPKILLLDEPAAGIPADQSAELFEVIADLPRDVTILFVEHDMNLVFRFAEQITVLVGGRVLTQGTPEQIAADQRVREVYLGEAEHG